MSEYSPVIPGGLIRAIRRLGNVISDNNRGVASEERIEYLRGRAEQALPLFEDGPPDPGELREIKIRAKWNWSNKRERKRVKECTEKSSA